MVYIVCNAMGESIKRVRLSPTEIIIWHQGAAFPRRCCEYGEIQKPMHEQSIN